jgi:hypothetical protein
LKPTPFHPVQAGIDELDNFLCEVFATSHYVSSGKRQYWNTEPLEYAHTFSVFARLLWRPFMKLVAVAFHHDYRATVI